ncbi:MAG TPA: bifunctional phosphoribosylaminoimidazolecarboxamide formyltransferase/IMP cyclohydrolase [Pirellulales bacterium]|jgi:phosphoribosylaminoimidazolecarboxamide formyltransferase/IMP cyclohydrolase|nr:bifunctional phosphoribosylaminoimidazolecarboxamide formyltransferase/IMP cyclohydrolase [Pirellulales bacterium]
MQSPRIERALISVSDKTGLDTLVRALAQAGVKIYSTGGTRKFIESLGIDVVDVAAYTCMPEMMDGRVKTLHPKIHGGILCRRDHADDLEALKQHGIVPFELLVVNLYPFRQTVARPNVSAEEAIEQIDIGGPSLIRAAAKNHAFVTVVTSPGQYADVTAALVGDRTTTLETRRRLAAEAFAHTASYDAAIADWFDTEKPFPHAIRSTFERQDLLRYGENPHQQGALYTATESLPGSLVRARKLHGKELSYNNLLDLDSALAIVQLLDRPAVSVIKHNNPCGAAEAERLAEAARRALAGDPTSAFGSVLGFNRTVDAASAEVLAEPGLFIEAIVAPEFEPAAIEILTSRPKWKANVRLLAVGELSKPQPALEHRFLAGGMLVQTADNQPDPEEEWKVVTRTAPSDAQLADLRFGCSLVRHVRSNAIVVARDRALAGVGAGQMSRVDSVRIALEKAGERARGAALASDAFFPFADSIPLAKAAGVATVIQPGGSRNDADVIAACDEHGIAMIFTGRRHFKH